MWPFSGSAKSISQLRPQISREEIVRNSRVLILDDEEPQLKHDLEKNGFAVNWFADISADLTRQIEGMHFDLMLLDFSGVGAELGGDGGLDILRHIKRVAPSLAVLSYTSKALKSKHGDFYRLTDGILAKDAGIAESMERIENALRVARSPENMWKALLHKVGIQGGTSEAEKLERRILKAASQNDAGKQISEVLSEVVKSDEAKVAAIAIGRRLLQVIATSL